MPYLFPISQLPKQSSFWNFAQNYLSELISVKNYFYTPKSSVSVALAKDMTKDSDLFSISLVIRSFSEGLAV